MHFSHRRGRGTGSPASLPSAPVTTSLLLIWPSNIYGSFLAETIQQSQLIFANSLEMTAIPLAVLLVVFNGLLASLLRAAFGGYGSFRAHLTQVCQPMFFPTRLGTSSVVISFTIILLPNVYSSFIRSIWYSSESSQTVPNPNNVYHKQILLPDC